MPQENSPPAFKRPANSEDPYNLNAISNDDVVEFFRNDKAVRKHWQKIMDTDEHDSEFQRHVNCLTTRGTTPLSKMKQETNFSFLRAPKEFETIETDVLTTLSEILSEILNLHPKLGLETDQTKKHYTVNVLIPEGVEKFLMHKFNMSEAQAKECYRKHHVTKCDHCDLYFIKDSDIDEHFEKVHESSVDLENHIRDILKVAIGTISKNELQKRLKKYYDKTALSLRKKEINKLHVKVQNEINKKKDALAKDRQQKEAHNHEEDEDFLFMDLE